MEFEEVLKKRRSVRSYLATPVEPALIERIVDAARRAPTAGFSQGLDFVVMDDPVRLARFWELTGSSDDAGGGLPTAVVIVLSDPRRYLSRYSEDDKAGFGLQDADAWPVRFWDVDGGMASMILLLAAVDAGLGAWFFGVAEGEAEVRSEFGIPADRNMVGIIGLGYADPAEVRIGSGVTRKRRPLEEQLHRNAW
jgi:nitroreductase